METEERLKNELKQISEKLDDVSRAISEVKTQNAKTHGDLEFLRSQTPQNVEESLARIRILAQNIERLIRRQ